jgi:hypothetical protein
MIRKPSASGTPRLSERRIVPAAEQRLHSCDRERPSSRSTPWYPERGDDAGYQQVTVGMHLHFCKTGCGPRRAIFMYVPCINDCLRTPSVSCLLPCWDETTSLPERPLTRNTRRAAPRRSPKAASGSPIRRHQASAFEVANELRCHARASLEELGSVEVRLALLGRLFETHGKPRCSA